MLQFYPCTLIISGGANGADLLAKRYASECGKAYKEFLPNWNLYGKSAGFLRNEQIVEACDELVAFWNKVSSGTKCSINLAINANKPVHIYWPPPKDFMEGIGI